MSEAVLRAQKEAAVITGQAVMTENNRLRARNAALIAWVEKAPHQPKCGRTYGLENCT